MVQKLVKAAMDGARATTARFNSPHDEWTPMWLGARRVGGELAAADVTALDPDSEARSMWRITKATQDFGADEVAVVISAWMMYSTAEEEARRVHPLSEDPARSESVIITYMAKGTSPSMYIAPVVRFEDKPPYLGEFRKLGPESRTNESVVAAIRAGFGE